MSDKTLISDTFAVLIDLKLQILLAYSLQILNKFVSCTFVLH